jgi:hypothetical protein
MSLMHLLILIAVVFAAGVYGESWSAAGALVFLGSRVANLCELLHEDTQARQTRPDWFPAHSDKGKRL